MRRKKSYVQHWRRKRWLVSNTPDPITTLRALVDAQAKATPAPWKWRKARTLLHLQDSEGSCFSQISMPLPERAMEGKELYKANAAFIAACGSADFASLLRAFEELRRENTALKNKNAEIECPVCGDDPSFCGCGKSNSICLIPEA